MSAIARANPRSSKGIRDGLQRELKESDMVGENRAGSFYNSHEKCHATSAGIGVAKPSAHLSRAAAVPTHGF